jgi:hypothetical protein
MKKAPPGFKLGGVILHEKFLFGENLGGNSSILIYKKP